jgi:flavin reductase (DIM6/NTAB) family NADH-FMN oxidoreductase RutF
MMEVENFYLLLHPRPAYLIGSGKVGEKVNFMAASWVSPVSEEPPLVGVAIDVNSYTRELIDTYGEFTVNILPLQSLEKLYYAGTVSGRSVDKTKVISYGKGEKVDAPVAEEAIGVVECRVYTSIKTEDVVFYLGEVLSARADERFFGKRSGWDLKKTNLSLHNWGAGFYEVGRLHIVRKGGP